MTQYLLSVFQPDGPPPAEVDLAAIVSGLDALNADIRAAGGWVFSAGLTPASSATVAHAEGKDVLLTDGPYTEGKEHLGGFTVVEAPDLDVALVWASRMAEITTLPIEVRPVQGVRG